MAGTDLADPMASVRAYIAGEKSDNTRRAYRSDWDSFTTWCEAQDLQPLPATPAAVARYLAHLADADLAPSSIERRRAAIRYAHKAAGHEPPTNSEAVKATMRGIRRTKKRATVRKAPAVAAAIAAMLEQLPATVAGLRDRALLLIAFAAALRRSELVDLKVNDIDRHERGIVLQIRSSKTDQDGEGAQIPVPNGVRLRPVAALDAWLEVSGIAEGPIFRAVDRHGRVSAEALTDRSVARIVKRAAAAAGLEERIFSGHSMRAGFVTQALEDNVDFFKIMGITRHVKVETLKIYDRRGSGFSKHAGDGFL
jgi:site-specific recombinase XerD